MADRAPDVMRSWLERHAPWTLGAGRWTPLPAQSWAWIDSAHREVCRYAAAQLKSAWDEIVRQSDMTWALLRRIDWMQVDVTVVRGVTTVICTVGGDVFGVVLQDGAARTQSKQEALPAMFIALLVMAGSASEEERAALEAALGIGVN